VGLKYWISTMRSNEVAYCHTCRRSSDGKFGKEVKVESFGGLYFGPGGHANLSEYSLVVSCSASTCG